MDSTILAHRVQHSRSGGTSRSWSLTRYVALARVKGATVGSGAVNEAAAVAATCNAGAAAVAVVVPEWGLGVGASDGSGGESRRLVSHSSRTDATSLGV